MDPLQSHFSRALRKTTGLVRVAGLALLASLAHAQAPYPSHPLTLVVPYPAGGSADILARAIGEKLAERLGQAVVVDNRAGAATAIGARAVARAAPDGYTLMMGTVSSQAINPAMSKVGYDPIADFTPIAPVASIPFVLVTNPALGAASVADLVAMAKARPGLLAYASAGPGTSNHLAGELFATAMQIKLLHVPYKGSAPALNDTLAGHTSLMFDLQATAMPYLQAGKLKALAVTSRKRSSLLPNVPTMIESGVPDYKVSAWFGLFAPAGLPQPILQRLGSEITAIVKDAGMRKRLQDLGAEPESGTPEEFASYVKDEATKWAATVKAANLAP